MSKRLICLISVIFFLFLFSSPVLAQSCGQAPQPNSPAIDLIIKQAQSLGGAAANVPAKVLKAIYWIEGTEAYTSNPQPYMTACQKRNPPTDTGLGWLQITDEMYQLLVPQNEQMSNDEGVCTGTGCQLSRCKPVDAFEIAARVLLYKIGLWDTKNSKATGKITTLGQVYNASCYYYGGGGLGGPFDPNDITNNLGGLSALPPDGQVNYCEFVCNKSGFCNSTASFPWPRGPQSTSGGAKADWQYQACATSSPTPQSTNFPFHPLRPFPDKPITTDKLTPYCAMRPTIDEKNTLDRRGKNQTGLIDLKTVGILTQDFSKFITPLISITDPKKADYLLPFNQKAQRYLADFLEGRAYYEPDPEPANPTFAQQQDIFNRLGVFRKLAPQSYQDKLKRAIIQRAVGNFYLNPYGFEPASPKINNYIVGSWLGQPVTLKDFLYNWAPLRSDYSASQDDTYERDYVAWKAKDGAKWYSLWPYVPMFTRDDAQGFIQILDSGKPPYGGPPYYPGASYEEEVTSNTHQVPVSFPHLARTYEVSTSLSYLLTPEANHEPDQIPVLADEWTMKPWEGIIWWLDPSLRTPTFIPPNDTSPGLEYGPLCEIDPRYLKTITSSGDPAYDSVISTDVNRKDLDIILCDVAPDECAHRIPPERHGSCIRNWDCEECVEEVDQNTGKTFWHKDVSACFFVKVINYNPTFLLTKTPFLQEILTSTMLSQRGIFDLFKPAGTPKEPYEEYDWPGVGNYGEESPVYSFSNGKAHAGYFKNPPDMQSYYYRYLGSIQCAKEKVLQVLQPFITGSPYEPYAYACFPELTPPTGTPTGSPGTLPTGPKWLQWPSKNPSPISQCFNAPGNHPHAGLDFVAQPANGAPIYPGAVGTVVKVGHTTVDFGHFVIIKHDNGFSTIYGHLQPNIQVHEGQVINNLNTVLGYQDSSGSVYPPPTASCPTCGAHVHFGLSRGSAESDFWWSGPISDPCAAMENCSCP